jgi:hypothetical protein
MFRRIASLSVRSVSVRIIAAATFTALLVSPCFAAPPQDQTSGQNKHIDIQSSSGDLHVGIDADAKKTGLPLYPGARAHHDEDSTGVNLGLLTDAFGIKLVVVKYDSDDASSKVIDFYRDHLKKYGKVLECHSVKHGGVHADFNDSDRDDDKKSGDEKSKPVKCEGDNQGPVTELKVGTEDNQHVVEVEPASSGSGSTFALLYFHTRGKQGDI